MKKTTILSLISYLEGETITNTDEILDELKAEIAKGAEKAQANREMYATAHDVVVKALANITAPVTISELYDEVANDLPEGMTKGKVQYAVTRLWSDEIAKTEGKVNAYSLR